MKRKVLVFIALFVLFFVCDFVLQSFTSLKMGDDIFTVWIVLSLGAGLVA